MLHAKVLDELLHGRAHVVIVGDGDLPIPEYRLPEGGEDAERLRLERAIAAVRRDLENFIASLRERTSGEEVKVFECHLMMMEDEVFTGEMASGVFAGCQIPEDWEGYDSEKDLTAVAVQLETGRTHQIRVHMSYIGHPLVGDTLYGESMRDYMIRQALHSWKLDFIHPVSRSRMHLEAPLPEDMRQLFMQSKNRLQL